MTALHPLLCRGQVAVCALSAHQGVWPAAGVDLSGSPFFWSQVYLPQGVGSPPPLGGLEQSQRSSPKPAPPADGRQRAGRIVPPSHLLPRSPVFLRHVG